jgi:predicted alpha/beta superfamily hydrolase
MKRRLALMGAIACLATAALCAQTDGTPIASGTYRVIHSKVLGEDRTLLVHLPGDYAKSDKKYPVVYKLDGEENNFLQAFAAAQYLLDWMDKAPNPIIVGIANTNRNRDMGLDQQPDNFIQFLKDELIPFVDKNYRTSAFRTLCGQSASSVFAAYSFLKQPSLFNAYILSSFGLFRESVATSFYDALKRQDLKNVGTRYLFVANGKHDSYDPDGARTKRGAQFLQSLRAAAPSGILIETRDYDDEGHVPSTTG